MIKDIILGLMWAMPFIMLISFGSVFSERDNRIIEFYRRVFSIRPRLLVSLGLICMVLIFFLSPQFYYDNSHGFTTTITTKSSYVTVTGNPRYSILMWAGVMLVLFPVLWLYINLFIDKFVLKRQPTKYQVIKKLLYKSRDIKLIEESLKANKDIAKYLDKKDLKNLKELMKQYEKDKKTY